MILADFHRKAGREHLPWRRRGVTPYGIWVSEIMLQQTQVSRVISYYEKFLERFPDVGTLAGATWEEFLPYYQGLGYYARGRNMLLAARMIVSEHGGKFPKGVKELETLPGVGPYTAAAIASFAYGKDTIAWDTNLRRVVGRYFFGSKRADIPEELPPMFSMKAKTFNATLMDFGSALCVARPKCGACPLSSRCAYFAENGRQEARNQEQGARSGKKNWKDARVFVILHENHRKYYSPYKTKWAPFIVPSSHNTRAGIKDWFQRKYGIELSVRPPHRREVIDGRPTLSVNAQILAGRPEFVSFSREDARRKAS